MDKSNIGVVISGASGRMGRQLVRSLLSFNCEFIILKGVVTNRISKFIGNDVGVLIGSDPLGIKIHGSLENISSDFDILIDFSDNQATLEYLDFCKKNNKNMVIGTTGFKKKDLLLIQEAANNIGIVFSPNFSVMMTLMLKLLEKSASIIGHLSDIEIIEMHHRNKNDSPSGTALRMQKVIMSALSLSDSKKKKNNFFSMNNSDCGVQIHAIRAGNIVGEHSVFFVDSGERLEIIHRACDRAIFSNGAIRSAIWLGKDKIGLFDMIDVLGLGDF